MQNQSSIQEKVLNYPILQYLNKENGELILDPTKSNTQLKPVGKAVFGTIATVGAVGAGYAIWTYILPPVMLMLGQFLALAVTGLAAVTLFMLLPTILKGIKRFSKNAEKALIRQDPFGELEDQLDKMNKQKVTFKNGKLKIKSLRSMMLNESTKSGEEANNFQDRIIAIRNLCKRLQDKRVQYVQQGGEAAEDTDEVVDIDNQLSKKLAEAQGLQYQYEQSVQLVQKYGARAAIMGKLDRNLSKAETAMDIKIQAFETTIKMLKVDATFATNARIATDAAKDAMHFTKEWQMDYAIDIITNNISFDLAKTAENQLDIEKLTSEFSIDNEDMFRKLDVLADNIVSGSKSVPNSDQYAKANYKLTSEDKKLAGGFDGLF